MLEAGMVEQGGVVSILEEVPEGVWMEEMVEVVGWAVMVVLGEAVV